MCMSVLFVASSFCRPRHRLAEPHFIRATPEQICLQNKLKELKFKYGDVFVAFLMLFNVILDKWCKNYLKNVF